MSFLLTSPFASVIAPVRTGITRRLVYAVLEQKSDLEQAVRVLKMSEFERKVTNM
jgi:hypothetical protein